MGKFLAPGRMSGRVYDITIKGDTPSPTEQARIKSYVDEQESLFQQNFSDTLGFELSPPDDGTALGRGWRRGVEDARGGLGELAQTLGQRTGWGGLEQYGSEMEQNAALNTFRQDLKNPAPLSFRDVKGLGSGLTYLGELAGSSAPVMGGIAAGSGIAALAGAPAVLGGALAATPYYMGSIMQEQERNKGEDNVDLGTALAGGAIAAALDSASLGVLGRLGLGKAAIGAMSGEVGRGLTMRLLTGAGAGALTEGTTETLQEVTQLLAGGTDPNAPEVQDRLLEAFVGGGVLGGVLGGAGRGAFGKRPEVAAPPEVTPPAATPPTLALPAPTLALPAPTPAETTAPTTVRPAAAVLDELGVSPTAGIRKRVTTATESDDTFLEALKKYAATPGLKKDHRTAVKDYLASRVVAPAAAPTAAAPRFTAPITDAEYTALSDADKLTYLDEVGMPPVPEVVKGKKPKAGTKATAPTPATGLQIQGVEEAVAKGVAPIKVMENGKEVPFKNFALSVDGNTAEVGFVERDKSARKGVGYDAYVALGNDLAARGVTLRSTETLQAPGRALWEKLQKQGKATYDPATKRFSFAAEPAPAPEAEAKTGAKPSQEEVDAAAQDAIDAVNKAFGKTAEAPAPEAATVSEATPAPVVYNAAPGAPTGTAGQAIPEGIRPVQGKQLETQAAVQRESVARQISVKNKLEAKMADLRTQIGNGVRVPDSTRAVAKKLGIKATEHVKGLTRELQRTEAQHKNLVAYLNSEAGQAQAETEGATNKDNIRSRAENDAARATHREWYAANTPAAVQAADADIRGEDTDGATFDPTTVGDKQRLLALLQTSARKLVGKDNDNARAAIAYFSKTRDIADALDNIAADVALPDIPGKRSKEGPYWAGTGKTAALKASQWVEANLSPEALAYLDDQIAYYDNATADAAGNVIDRQIKDTRANETADQKTLGEYYKAEVDPGIGYSEFARKKGISLGSMLRDRASSIAFGLEAPLHPTVVKALRNGNLRAALAALSATSTDPYISQLAKSLTNFVGDTKVYTTRSGNAASQALMRDLLMPTKTGRKVYGKYILMTEASFRESEAISPAYASAIHNSIILNEEVGLSAHTILHEVLHPVTVRELMQNPNGPVAKRLQTLYQQVYNAIGKEFEDRGEEVPYGLKSLAEFVAEALSNQDFQGILDRLYPTTKKVNALEQFVRTILNFVRARILKRAVKVYNDNRVVPSRMRPGQESVFDETDRLVRSIFNTAPEFGVYGPLFDTADRPAAAAEAFNLIGQRMHPFNPIDALKTDAAVAQAGRARRAAMVVGLNLFTPIRNMVDVAAKYFPDAQRVYENLTKNAAYKQELSKEMWNTLTKANTWLDKHPQLEQAFHSLRTRASKQEIDPRLPAKFYNSFVVRCYDYNADGTIGDVKYRYFDSASDARDFITKVNDAEAKGAATTKAKLLITPDAENAALHRKFSDELTMLEAQAPGAKKAYTEYLNIAERLHREAGKALKQRIDVMYAGDENAYTRNTLLRDQYNKIFAERGLLAYQPLIREGSWRISYSGVHPDTNTVEPFVHYFGSFKEALKAKEALLALPAEYKIKVANGVDGAGIEISPRGIDAPYGNKQPVPATYVSDVVKAIKAAAIKDAAAAGRKALAEGKSPAEADAERERVFAILNANAEANATNIVEMALNALPESSIFSAYRARTGVSGFTGDLSPLKAAFDEIENTFDAPDVSRGMFEQFMTSMTQKVAAIHQQADADLVRKYLNDRLKELSMQVGRTITDRDYEKAVTYHEALTTSLNNPTIRRSQIVNNINAGAYMFTLLGNVSSVVMNLMGAVTFVYPRLAARYGPARAAKMMLQSIRTISNSGRMRLEPTVGPGGTTVYEEMDAGVVGRSIRNYKFSGVDHAQGFNKGDNKTNTLEYLVREGEKRHMLVDSLVYDYIDSNKTQFELLNKIMYWGSAPLHHVERLVRESAMLANYELELRRMADEKGSDVLTQAEMEEAARTAVREAELMTGTIPATASSNWSQIGIMPNIAMYKRYPLSMMAMIIGDIARSVPSRAKLAEMYGEDTAEFRNALQERKIARLQTASVFGAMALFSGAMGMPLYGMLADLWDMLFTDDDEEGFDTLVRMGIGELGSKGILNYLTGAEFSARIGLSDIFYRAPLRAEDQPPLWNLIEGLGGPGVSLLSNWSTRTVDLLDRGEYFRALESAMPATIRNVLRGGRFLATGSAESLRDDIISEISPGQALAQALGFAPSSYIRQMELNSEAKRIETGVSAKKTKIMRALNMARRNGDTEAIADAMADIQEFNREHPDKRIDAPALQASRRTFARNTEKQRNGLVYSDPQAYDLQEVMRLMEEPASIWDTK